MEDRTYRHLFCESKRQAFKRHNTGAAPGPVNTIVGMRFKAWDGFIYICDSCDHNGVWMTREDCPPEHKNDTKGQWRRNVSERAIGRTFHLV
jgi:hypothetical protein